jgi:uncharacterized lipoprotein YddW (UPF0748 family)
VQAKEAKEADELAAQEFRLHNTTAAEALRNEELRTKAFELRGSLREGESFDYASSPSRNEHYPGETDFQEDLYNTTTPEAHRNYSTSSPWRSGPPK